MRTFVERITGVICFALAIIVFILSIIPCLIAWIIKGEDAVGKVLGLTLGLWGLGIYFTIEGD